jgi:hypothetical protein
MLHKSHKGRIHARSSEIHAAISASIVGHTPPTQRAYRRCCSGSDDDVSSLPPHSVSILLEVLPELANHPQPKSEYSYKLSQSQG